MNLDPATFGAILERSLDPVERHRLGAHFTPRAYIERLLQPTIEEPLRQEWQSVQTSARAEAERLAHAFLDKLCSLRVLDPACGTGNFLHVALDLFRRIEREVLSFLQELGGRRALRETGGRRVTPAQFLGIEVKPGAKAIAALFFPNIECRDALLSGGASPRRAAWPKADFVIGNPPFIGNKRMRMVLGDAYVDALQRAYPGVPKAADYVMYWWDRAATAVSKGHVRRAGLITTSSITQTFNRRVVQNHLGPTAKASLLYAIPDHPWVDADDGASVRIAMTVLGPRAASGRLFSVIAERDSGRPDRDLVFQVKEGEIHPDLTVGVDLTGMTRLASNRWLSCPGVQLSGQGFVLSEAEVRAFSERARERLIRPYLTGRDLARTPRRQFVIDTFGLTEERLRDEYPDAYQWLIDRVLPERRKNARAKVAREWWLHSEPRARFRAALSIEQLIGTSRTARHRVFQRIDGRSLPETKVLIVALGDAYPLGVLSSKVHVTFATAAGGWLGVGNDSTYNHTSCFDPFPFPACTEAQKKRIRKLGEALDAHRKRRQAEHPDLTITGMYNVLEKLRRGEALTEKEKSIHEHGLLSVLKKIHDDLDAAVLDAYGWPLDLTDEQILERLVALNAERAEEERGGLVRWLRPELQEPRPCV